MRRWVWVCLVASAACGSPVVPPPDDPPVAVAAVFSSTWDTAAGLSQEAVTDGGKWPNYWEFSAPIQLLSVVPSGPNGHHALQVLQRGERSANLQINDVVPPTTDFYLRFYFRNDDTSGAGDHIATVDYRNYQNLTFLRKVAGLTDFQPNVSAYGCADIYSIAHWRPARPLQNGRWWRFEYHVTYLDPTHIRVEVRVYDDADVLILQTGDFRHAGFGSTPWSGRSDWTLASYYAAGHSFCVQPLGPNGEHWMGRLAVGNNGQRFAADTGLAWYFAGVEIRTDKWPGPLVAK